MKSDSVEIAFQLMMEELDRKSEDLNSEGAALFRNSKYDDAKAKADIGTSLKNFRRKVESLRAEWQSGHAETFPSTETIEIEEIVKKINSGSKSSKTVLVVKFPDGLTVYENFAADSFCKALQIIGLERVAALGLEVNREYLVSRKPPAGYSQFKELDGYFIITHSSTEQKRELLERVSTRCGVPLSINIVAR